MGNQKDEWRNPQKQNETNQVARHQDLGYEQNLDDSNTVISFKIDFVPEGNRTESSRKISTRGRSKLAEENEKVQMYISPDLKKRLEREFSRIEHLSIDRYGESLQKNRHFYEAVIERGLADADLQEHVFEKMTADIHR